MDGGSGVMSTLLCIGLGYTASVFTKRLAAEGWHIIGFLLDDKKVAFPFPGK
jgi:hypothetical protein